MFTIVHWLNRHTETGQLMLVGWYRRYRAHRHRQVRSSGRGRTSGPWYHGLFIGLLLFGLSCSPTAPVKIISDPGAELQEKIAALLENSAKSPVPPKNLAFTEAEVNLFLASYLKPKIPQAIGDPSLTLLDDSQILARVLVDVDEFKRKRKRTSGPLNFFSGKIPVILRGDLTSGNGQGQFSLRSAEVNGLTLPKNLALDLLANHTRTRDNPQGFELEKPFDLPLNIRQLILSRGQVVVLQ